MSSCMNFIHEFGNVFFVLFHLLILLLPSFDDFSKGDSSLSSVCLAGNVDYLEDDDAGFDDVPLDSESEL